MGAGDGERERERLVKAKLVKLELKMCRPVEILLC